ncbi:MAG TPA: FAD-binding oxidoreductase [Devosia sp.]|jgi:FAD/FMN-containing dehydrogenase|uniref:FAD-binding oxidoreductase n=1 Tax=Devosia sp. TaxID=1871048 RepID=UPI002F958392
MNVHLRVGAPKTTPLLALGIEALRARLNGRLVGVDDEDYDATRGIAHSNWDQYPLFVARVADAPDVADVVDFARRNQLEIAIRSGGHSVCGHSASQDGVVIDLRDLQSLDIDLDEMTVWVGSGLTAGEVSAALDQHRVVVGFGDSAMVGVGGLTLGGGVGYMTRKFGLTIDALVAAEVVTASGNILMVSETSHPELFWALRGGGGNFGVVTRFCFRLNPLPEFTGGPLVLPATPEVLAGFVAAAKAAPDELTTILLAMPAPPMPFLPPELFGKTVLIGMMAYAGPAGEAQAALAPFRALAEPIADLVRPGPYSMMYLPEDPSMKPTISVRTLFKDDLSVTEAAEVLRRLELCDAPMRMAQIRVLGGAAARISNEATAYANRDAAMLVGFLAIDGTAEAAARHDIWGSDCVAALGGAPRGTYVNFLADQGEDMVRASYPGATWQRLRQVKQSYDPANVFRRNQNIPPV